ncbi:MFS transporter [Streptomyces sp. NPDC056716]|uniref:MFS transporter n=1 Tax=unclassified Streptomyces TaxID=2593676 RepID=UPI0036886744
MPIVRNGPFAHAGYRWLWSGQVVSIIGDQLFPMAVVSIALGRAEPVLSLGVVFGARFLALALLIVVGGVLADRMDKLRLMISSDVIRMAAVLLLIGIGPAAPIWVLAAITFLMGAGESLFQPSYDAVVPSTVPADQLEKANAATNMLKNIGQVVGPGGAGLMVAWVGPTPALWLDAGTFAVSTCTLLVVRRKLPLGSTRTEHDGGSMLADAAAGIRVVLKMRWLMALEAMAVVHVLLAVGPWFVLVPVIAQDRLNGPVGYGFVLSAFALGGIGGAALAGWAQKHFQRLGLWALGGLGFFGVACLAFLVTTSTPVLALLFAVAGAGTQFFDVVKTTAIQVHVPRNLLGRVFALDFFASFVTMPAGQMLAGLFIAGASQAVTAMAVAGVIVIATTLLPLLVPGVATFGGKREPVEPVEAKA